VKFLIVLIRLLLGLMQKDRVVKVRKITRTPILGMIEKHRVLKVRKITRTPIFYLVKFDNAYLIVSRKF